MPVVVVKMVSYEDAGSCSYARKYLVCDEEYVNENQGLITILDLEQNGRWVTISGTPFPDIKKVNDKVPYNINQVDIYNIKQKVAKTVTIFE